MFSRNVMRCFHRSNMYFTAVDKSLLSKLRKRTGYTFANCKEALKLNENDILKAEQWLKKQAQELGWEKAVKLQGRATSQGLIGLASRDNEVAMVELNCETDFVSRNDKFCSLVDKIASICLQRSSEPSLETVTKHFLSGPEIGQLSSDEGTLADLVALSIGLIGENMSLRRGVIMKASGDVKLSYDIHPPLKTLTQTHGKYGAIVAYTVTAVENPEVEIRPEVTAKELCQHIIGMNPTVIGDSESEPLADSDDEKALYHQDFLLEPEIKVGQLLQETGVKIVDFVRFECGESSDEIVKQESHEVVPPESAAQSQSLGG